ncbi:hypothetical protein U8L64_00185, partial [Pseudomonas sp. FIP_A4]
MEVKPDDHLTIAQTQHIKLGTAQLTKAGREIHLKAGQKMVIPPRALRRSQPRRLILPAPRIGVGTQYFSTIADGFRQAAVQYGTTKSRGMCHGTVRLLSLRSTVETDTFAMTAIIGIVSRNADLVATSQLGSKPARICARRS